MGDPKYPRKVWRKPKRPLNYELKMDELQTLGTFGLRTKRELWKAHTELSRVRQQARSLLALTQKVRGQRTRTSGRKGGAVGVAKGGLAAPVKKASSGAPAAEAAPAAATADTPAPAAEAAPAEKKE